MIRLRFVPVLLFAVVLSVGCSVESDTEAAGSTAEIPQEAIVEANAALASGRESDIEQARHLLDRVLDRDGQHIPPLKARARIAIHQGQFDNALQDLRSVRDISPDEDSGVLRCMLKEAIKGKDSSQACYLHVAESYEADHQPGDEIHPNWVAAELLGGGSQADTLKTRYLAQEEKKSKTHAEFASALIERFIDRSYVREVLETEDSSWFLKSPSKAKRRK